MIDRKSFLIKLTPLFLIILNFILKMLFVSYNSIGGDEPFSIYHAQMDVSEIIQKLSAGNNPPLYEIMLHFWIKLFGICEFSVRLPSVIFSVLTVYFIYQIGKMFFNYPTALLVCLLFSFSNYQTAFSHEARVYALFALLTAMSMYYFLNICSSRNVLKYYSLMLTVNVMMLYSHYFSGYVIIIQTISVLFLKEIRNQQLKNYIFYIVLLMLLYIPNLKIILFRFSESTLHGTWVKSPNGIESIYNMLWQFSNKPLTTVICLLILSAAVVKLILKKGKNIPVSNKIILIWFLFPFFSMFFISYWIPMFLDRYLIFVSLGYYFVLAVCANHIIDQGKYRFIIPVILLAIFAVTFNPNVDNKRHVKETVEKIKSLKDNNTKVLICPANFILNFTYYYNLEMFKDVDQKNVYDKMIESLKKQNIFTVNNINEVNIIGFERIIYLDAAANFDFPDNNIITTLDKNYQQKNSYKFYEIFNVYEFIKK